MVNFITLGLLSSIKTFAHAFYRLEPRFLPGTSAADWRDVRLIVLLNHTSLFEPLFIRAMPWHFVRRFASNGVFPAADVTLARPLAGRLIRAMAPNVAALTRKRDDGWSDFVSGLTNESILIFIPEGRMKRRDGLDRNGQAMTVRGGIADVLRQLRTGKMMLAYSGGLHHVQAPGDRFPKIFRTLELGLEALPIDSYLQGLGGASLSPGELRAAVSRDLEQRRDRHCADGGVQWTA